MTDDTTQGVPAPAQAPVASTESKPDVPALVVPPELADAKPESAEPAAEQQAEDEQPTEEQKQRKSRAQERVEQAVRQKNDALRKLADAQARLQHYERRYAEADKANPDDWDAQQKATISKTLIEQQADETIREARQAIDEAKLARQEAFNAKVEAVADQLPDFWAKFGTAQVTEDMADIIVESDLGPQIGYYLGSNPQEAAQIAALPPVKQARALTLLEAKLKAAPAARKVSNAPPPPPRVGGTVASGPKDPADMTEAEYSKWYRERQKA